MSGHIEWRDTVRQEDGTLKAVKGKDDRWRARWKYRRGDRWLSKTFACDKKADAVAAATAWGVEQARLVSKGEWRDPLTEPTFAAVAEEYRATWGHLAVRTRNGYSHILALHLLPRWGDVKISDITTTAIEDWLDELMLNPGGKPRTRKTIDRIYGVMRGVMKRAKHRKYITENPCADVTLPRGRRAVSHRKLYLGPDEVRSLANAIHPHWRVAVYVAAWTGLRAGELWGLRVRDVDLVAGRLTVEQALKEVNGKHVPPEDRGLTFGAPKSEASARTLTMPDPITQLLAAYLSARPGGNPNPDALVFTAPEGGPVRHSLFYARAWQPAVRRVFPVGHPNRGLRWHDLRHTAAKLALSVSGGDLHVVKEMLGHEDIQTTVNVYGGLLEKDEAKLALGLAAMFNAAVEPATNVIPIRALRTEAS